MKTRPLPRAYRPPYLVAKTSSYRHLRRRIQRAKHARVKRRERAYIA